MAVDKKISQLTSLAQVDVSASTDVLPIVDTSATETKKITVSALVGAGATAGISGAVLTNGTINSTTIGATTPSTGAFTTLSASGNLTFSGTAQRITGDMSNATFANRLVFQTSTTNGATALTAFPNGTSAVSLVDLTNSSDGANNSYARLMVTSGEMTLRSLAQGTGTLLPMTFWTNNTERMRLDTSGNLGIGTASPVTTFGKNLTLYNDANTGTVASNTYLLVQSLNRNGVVDIASSATGTGGLNFSTTPGTTLAGIAGDVANSALLFRSGGTTERMRIDSSGNVGIGTASPSNFGGVNLQVQNSTIGSILWSNGTITGQLLASASAEVTVGSRSNHPLRFGTNDTERMRIDTSGNVGIGGTAGASVKISLSGTAPSSSGLTFGYYQNMTLPSSTTSAYLNYTVPAVASGATVTTLGHFYAAQGTFTGTATNQYGFVAESSLTGATNNYGFYSNIASGSNRWNFYAAGTAQNYFAGDTGVGATPAANYRFWVKGSDSTSSNAAIGVVNSSNTNMFYLRNDNYFNSGAINNYSVAGTTVVIDSNNFLGKTTSSLRYKKDIVNYDKGLLAISKLRPVYYKSAVEGPNGLDPKQHAGLIAEEIEAEGFEEFLIRDNDGKAESIQYPNMVALLVKAVQELKAELEALKAA